MTRPLKLLISIEDLRAGGAQTFALRFSQYCCEMGHEVYLFQHYNWLIDKKLLKDLSPSSKLIEYNLLLHWLDYLLFRFENLLQKIFWFKFQPRKHLLAFILKKKIKRYEIEFVFSHTVKSDYVCSKALQRLNIPFIITMHGDYDEFYEFSRNKNKLNSYLNFLNEIYLRTNFLVYLSEKNLFTLKLLSYEQKVACKKIYNGFKGTYSNSLSKSEVRKSLNIPENDTTLVMVARGVEGKGWKELIESFEKANINNTKLVLIGSGEFLDELRKNTINDNIIFIGNHPNPIDIIKACDIGLLPSKLKESLPNSIIEYLFCGLPVIATDVGEVSNMIKVENDLAGILITFPTDNESYEKYKKELTMSIMTLSKKDHYIRTKNLTSSAFQKFEMKDCYKSYFSFIFNKN